MTYASKNAAGANSHTLIPSNGSVPRSNVNNFIALVPIFPEWIWSMIGLQAAVDLTEFITDFFLPVLLWTAKVLPVWFFLLLPVAPTLQ